MALPEPQEQLCFSPEELLSSEFQVEDFVSRCRKRVTMEGLREELHSYFKTLKSAMVELINKDYADFVTLSANLAGIDKSIGNLMTPLKQLQVEIKDIKGTVDEAILSVQSKLDSKLKITKQKATLCRLITILESMDRLERLLHIQDSKDSSEIHSLSQKREWEPIVMKRVAMEFNKLQYNVSLVTTQPTTHPLVEDSHERIAAITHSLQSWLESSLRASLASEDRGALISCLQTYTHIGQQEAAEGMFRSTVVHPHLDQMLTTKNLITHPQGLSGLYADILTFVPKHCALLVDITSKGSASDSHAPPVSGFDFLVNSVWPEVVSLIEQKISVIFAPGNPDTFHQNYTTSMEFVDSLERLCSTEDSVKRLRAHPAYTSFMSKWSLPVYFQIRFQEIAGGVESSFVLPLERGQPVEGSDKPAFKLGVFQGVWSALVHCWSPGVFLPALVHRFWKLSLQIVMRTALWLEGLCADRSSESSSVQATPSLTLQDCLLIIADLEQLSAQCQSLAGMALPHVPDHIKDLVQGGIDDAKERLDQLVPQYSARVVEEISAECSKSIESVQTIPRLFRRTNRHAPSKPSTFTGAILHPLEQRLEDFPPQYKPEWIKSIIESITEKYYRLTSELLASVKRTEDSLLKLNAYRKSSAPVSSGEMSDDNKIRLQVALDIEHYSMQVASLDSQCLQLTAVKQLLIMGQTSKSVAMETIQEH